MGETPKLCMSCMYRRFANDRLPGDMTPCRLYPDTPLRIARGECDGNEHRKRKAEAPQPPRFLMRYTV